MVNLKSIYFYFLALQISVIKSLKKIYFTTSFYNKSLVSKTPQQFYFHPNPFLLSLISNFKKHSFKISEIDPNIFWVKQKSFQKEKEIHTFLWLNLIDRKNDGKAIQKIINNWMMKNRGYKRNFWESTVLSKRIISWLLNVDIILNNELFEFKRNFLNSIVSQTNHLKKNIKFEKDYSKRIQISAALLLSGLVFKEYVENYNIGIKELEKLIKKYFDQDGFPYTRNPNDLIFFCKYLILCKECIRDAQQYVPEFLEEIIKKNLKCIKFILTPNDQLPLFNGGTEKDLKDFSKFVNNFEHVSTENKNIVGGIQKLKFKNSFIYLDVGAPPDKEFSKSYQSGPLSFEYYLDERKIITNCGFGSNISTKAELLSRLTSAQSTLTINDTSVTKFERNKLINKIFGNSVKNIFKISNLNFSEDQSKIKTNATHNGYEKDYGCIYQREISIDKLTGNISGLDEIIKKESTKSISYNLRFHLYPGMNAVKTMSGNGVLIQITKNRSLIFTIKDEKIKLEKSIFLGGNKILDNTCITISGNLINDNKIIQWEIRKKI